VAVGNRQRYRNLAIVLLAHLSAILPRHANRVRSFFGKARIVDDPGLDRPVALDLGENHLADFDQDLLVRPRRVANKMQQRLVLGRHPGRRRHRRHRFHTLAFPRQHKSQTIIPQRPRPIGVAKNACYPIDVSRKSRFTGFSSVTHSSSSCRKRIA